MRDFFNSATPIEQFKGVLLCFKVIAIEIWRKFEPILDWLLFIGCVVWGLYMIFLPGCAFSRQMDVHINGDSIRSPYGSGNADITYKSQTQWKFLDGGR